MVCCLLGDTGVLFKGSTPPMLGITSQSIELQMKTCSIGSNSNRPPLIGLPPLPSISYSILPVIRCILCVTLSRTSQILVSILTLTKKQFSGSHTNFMHGVSSILIKLLAFNNIVLRAFSFVDYVPEDFQAEF